MPMSKESPAEIENNYHILQLQIPTRDLRDVENEKSIKVKRERELQEMSGIVDVHRSNLSGRISPSLTKKERLIKYGAGFGILLASDLVEKAAGIHNFYELIGINMPFYFSTIMSIDHRFRKGKLTPVQRYPPKKKIYM